MCARLVLLGRGVCVVLFLWTLVPLQLIWQGCNFRICLTKWTSHSCSRKFHELNISVEKLLAKYCIHAQSRPRQCSFREREEFSTCRHGAVCPGRSNTATWPSPAKDPVPPHNPPSNPASGTPSCSESACPHPVELLVLFFSIEVFFLKSFEYFHL